MAKANTNVNSRSIRRIAIDGHFLDEVRTRLHTDVGSKSLSYLSGLSSDTTRPRTRAASP
jgi:hypothetical protein